MEMMTSQKLGTRHWTLPSNDLSNPTFVANPPDRCYGCRFTRFDALLEVARAEGLARLVHIFFCQWSVNPARFDKAPTLCYSLRRFCGPGDMLASWSCNTETAYVKEVCFDG